jgi:plastocyanin
MKRMFTLLTLMTVAAISYAQDHIVMTVGNTGFNPSSLTVFVGETVEFQNAGGTHNINGTQATYPANPASFGNSIGSGWTYQYTFTTVGAYTYRCDVHPNMVGTITVMEAPMLVTDLIITGLMDPQSSLGAGPKTVELYALNDIDDLSIYGLGVANNGGGTNGVEFTFPAVQLDAGSCIMLTDSNNLANFQTFFGFDPDFLVPGGATSAAGFNGDDALELFMNGEVVDVFGDINVDGTGTSWEHTDGWVYRVNGTGQHVYGRQLDY